MTKKENVRERKGKTRYENKYIEEKKKGNQERKYRKRKAK